MGIVSVYAVPLRLRDQVVGGLNLFRTTEPPLTRDDQRMAQALADNVAERVVRRAVPLGSILPPR